MNFVEALCSPLWWKPPSLSIPCVVRPASLPRRTLTLAWVGSPPRTANAIITISPPLPFTEDDFDKPFDADLARTPQPYSTASISAQDSAAKPPEEAPRRAARLFASLTVPPVVSSPSTSGTSFAVGRSLGFRSATDVRHQEEKNVWQGPKAAGGRRGVERL